MCYDVLRKRRGRPRDVWRKCGHGRGHGCVAADGAGWRFVMDIRLGDVLRMKKGHPCGGNEWEVQRVGMDFRLLCKKCGRMIMIPRKLAEKNLRQLTRAGVVYKPLELAKKADSAEAGAESVGSRSDAEAAEAAPGVESIEGGGNGGE